MGCVNGKGRNDYRMELPKVLIAEDDGIIARDIQYTLESMGYHVSAVVASGEESIKKALYFQPDVVLMDIRLNGNIDGLSAAREIYNRFQIPVIYISACGDEKTLIEAKKIDCFQFIGKPYAERELQEAIEQSLNNTPAH